MNTTTMAASAANPTATSGVRRAASAGQRFAEIMIAALFIVTAAASIYGGIVLNSVLSAPNYLAEVFANKGAVALGALMWSINNIGIVFIAVLAFPLLRRLNETLAVGYLTTRIIEGAVMMFGIAATLMLVPLSEAFVATGAPDGSWYQTLGDALLHLKLLGLSELALPLMSLGGMIFCWELLWFRLVPWLIAAVGLAGYTVMFIGGFASWFDVIDFALGNPAALLAVPVALFEIVLLPLWLMLKGFRMPAGAVAQ